MSEAEIREFFAKLRADILAKDEPDEAALKERLSKALAIVEYVVLKIASL